MENVGSIRKCVTGIKEEIKGYQLKKKATHVRGTAALKADAIKERLKSNQVEVRTLIREVKGNMEEIGQHLAEEKTMLASDIRHHKLKLSDVLGFGDEVRGFDKVAWDDSFDQLEIYAEFLGPEEYSQVKNGYERALNTME